METIFAFNKKENVYAKLTPLDSEEFEFELELLIPKAKELKIIMYNHLDRNKINSKELDWFNNILNLSNQNESEGWELIDKQRYYNVRHTNSW